MKMIFFVLLFSLPSVAVEVAAIDETKSGDIIISFTDESLYTALDKAWITHNCKARYTFSGALKETFAPKACRAEALKFILNTGYKPLENSDRTFSR